MKDESEILDRAEELYEDFCLISFNEEKELSERLDAAYEFDNICSAIHVFLVEGFISQETGKEFYKRFNKRWDESDLFLAKNERD